MRVGPEAMINGIPCIVGSTIKETIDGGGIRIENTFDIDAWVEAINRLKNDDVLYKKLSKKAIEKAKTFDFKVQYKKFENILKNVEN